MLLLYFYRVREMIQLLKIPGQLLTYIQIFALLTCTFFVVEDFVESVIALSSMNWLCFIVNLGLNLQNSHRNNCFLDIAQEYCIYKHQ